MYLTINPHLGRTPDVPRLVEEMRARMKLETNAPERSEIDLSAVFSALADPHRQKIIVELLQEPPGTERTCGSFDVPLSKSSRTFHFRVLREAGLTWDVNYGNRKGVILRNEDLETRFPGLLTVLANSTPSPNSTSGSA